MLNGGFLTITIGEVLGLIVTIVGIWLVVRQLNETRLASQMEGMISLSAMSIDMENDVKALREFTLLEEWEKLDDVEAYELIRGTDEFYQGYLKQATVYGLTGGLVREGALDIRVAAVQFGYFVPAMWRQFEKYTKMLRKEFGPHINENWEWLAMEFEKFDT